jgi:hypothetical protein
MNRLRLLILGLSAVLCALIGLELTAGSAPYDSSPLPGPARLLADEKQRPVAADNSRTRLQTILARPLFNPNRRPSETGSRGLPRLTGIVVTDRERLALFASVPPAHPLVATVGTHVGPYEVKEIADTGVTISGPDGTTTLHPAFDPNRPVPVPVPPRPPLPRSPSK